MCWDACSRSDVVALTHPHCNTNPWPALDVVLKICVATLRRLSSADDVLSPSPAIARRPKSQPDTAPCCQRLVLECEWLGVE